MPGNDSAPGWKTGALAGRVEPTAAEMEGLVLGLGLVGGEVVLRSAMTRWSEDRASLLSVLAGGAGEPEDCLDLLLWPFPPWRLPWEVDCDDLRWVLPPRCPLLPPGPPLCDLPRCLPPSLPLRVFADSEPESAAWGPLPGPFLLVERLLVLDDGRGLPAPVLMDVVRPPGPFFLGACLLPPPCCAAPFPCAACCCRLSSFLGAFCCA